MKNPRLAPSGVLIALIVVGALSCVGAWNEYNTDKVVLSDVKALTLHQGRMTNARRSGPVPQLKCVGGSAQHRFQPKVVQCINQGSDGYDIQWECKTDMDNSYKFGQVQVSCEGYDYPNDPYVLKGSCGLEYTIEFTEEGLSQEKQRGGNSYSSSYNNQNGNKSEGGFGGLVGFFIILFIIYVVYTKCIAPAQQHATPDATQGAAEPPPYGFRPEFMAPPQGPPPSYDSTQQSSMYPDLGSAYARASAPPPPQSAPPPTYGAPPPKYGTPPFGGGSTNTNGGGFWSGAATGGVLGYLFGNSGNRQPNGNRGSGWFSGNSGWGSQHQHHQHHSSPGSGFFSSNSSRSSSSSPSSSGTRTASGFAGTSRR